jgi:hypothetical protein
MLSERSETAGVSQVEAGRTSCARCQNGRNETPRERLETARSASKFVFGIGGPKAHWPPFAPATFQDIKLTLSRRSALTASASDLILTDLWRVNILRRIATSANSSSIAACQRAFAPGRALLAFWRETAYRARYRKAGERGTWDKAATGAIRIRSNLASRQARIDKRMGAAGTKTMF